MRAGRRERLAAAWDRLVAEDQARRDAQRARQEAWDAAVAAGKRRGGRRPSAEPPRANYNNTEPRANTTDPDVQVMRNQKGYVVGLAACESVWLLVCAAHNLRELHCHRAES